MMSSIGADPSMLCKSDAEFDEIVRAVTEEVLSYLAGVPIGALPFTPGPTLDDKRLVIGAAADRLSPSPQLGEIDPGITAQIAALSAASLAAPIAAQIAAPIASLIDHTLLKPEASRSDIEKLCAEAVQFGFASVCINPWYVPLAAEMVRGSAVKVCAVVGFPLGATLPRVKIYEAEEAIKLGAREIDMVQNIGALKSGDDAQVESDMRGVVEASHRGGAICKVILETALLTASEKVRASLAAKRAGADFVKTSTGFSSSGATAEDVALMRAAVGEKLGIKAAGGIRTLEDLRKMVHAGATRIGASASVQIIEQLGAQPPSTPISSVASPGSPLTRDAPPNSY
jgi:deoxyribose-phosphate aldolase